MKKSNVIEFIQSIKDCENIVEIHIEEGIAKDYIEIRYYDKNERYRRKSTIVKKVAK